MLATFLVAAMPFILNILMGLVKMLGGEGESVTWKRGVLALFALIGVIAAAAMNGTPLDALTIQGLIQTIFLTFGAFLASHGSYSLFFQKSVK